MWLDLGGLRVVHACWDDESMEFLRPRLGADGSMPDELIEEASRKRTKAYDAVEIVLKGPELDLGGRCYRDEGDHPRTRARYRWWDPRATTLRAAAEIPGDAMGCDGGPFPELPGDPIDPPVPPYDADVPVIVGRAPWPARPPPRPWARPTGAPI